MQNYIFYSIFEEETKNNKEKYTVMGYFDLHNKLEDEIIF